MAVHHAVGISRQRNSGYRLSMVNIVTQGLSTPDPSLSPTHLSIRRGRATTTHYTHHQVSLMVSHSTTLVRSLGLPIGPACEAGLSAGIRRERVSPQIERKKKREKKHALSSSLLHLSQLGRNFKSSLLSRRKTTVFLVPKKPRFRFPSVLGNNRVFGIGFENRNSPKKR